MGARYHSYITVLYKHELNKRTKCLHAFDLDCQVLILHGNFHV